MEHTTRIGPNVRRLIAYRITRLAIPDGTVDPMAAGTRAFLEPGRFAALTTAACQWVRAALADIQAAPDNPWPDDEAIAGEMLRQIDARLQR